VLSHPKRINLDGSASDGKVDEKARRWRKSNLRYWPHGHHERRKKPRRPLSGASTVAPT
jgi:hypothetical protein